MSIALIAIIISVFSVVIAAISLGWNIYRDVILKPKVIVSFDKKFIFGQGREPSPDYIGIHAVNHGPGPIILNTIILKDTSIWKRITKSQKHAVLIHDYKNPHSSKLPRRLEVGESIDLFLNYDAECFLKNDFSDLGIVDSFGRTNWAPRKYMTDLKEKWRKNFN